MKIYKGFGEIPQTGHAVATIGSFDGVHSGHMELLRRVTEIASQVQGMSMVVTFEPHPDMCWARAPNCACSVRSTRS